MANTNLAAIYQKIRFITRSPSPSQITDDQIREYVNTFLLYDLPYQLRLFSLKEVLTFYTRPNIDTYTSSTTVTDALYDFENRYASVHPPAYVAGYPVSFTQDRNVFYGIYPQINFKSTIGTGTGAALTFTGTSGSIPLLQNSIFVDALSAAGVTMTLRDYPRSDSVGEFGLENADPGTPSPYGQINYLTGVYSITFPAAPASGAPVYLSGIKIKTGRPLSMLYFDNSFVLRPVPDGVYAVQIEAYIQPTELLLGSSDPQIKQWWQYIALGASKKIFEDRMDYESVNMLMPTFLDQQSLVLSTSTIQICNQRTQTLFTHGRQYNFGWFPYWPY